MTSTPVYCGTDKSVMEFLEQGKMAGWLAVWLNNSKVWKTTNQMANQGRSLWCLCLLLHDLQWCLPTMLDFASSKYQSWL